MKKLLILLLFLSQFANNQLLAQSPELWGMTEIGGTHNVGTIYKTDSIGNNFMSIHSFERYIGENPRKNKLCLAGNGKLYGVTFRGGQGDYGVLFVYDPLTNDYNILFHFGVNTYAYGCYPYGGLMQASNGKLYGMTSSGGASNNGAIFEYDIIADTIISKVLFDGSNIGEVPFGDLLEVSYGKLLGLTRYGGLYNKGVLFEYNYVSDTCIKKIDFNGVNGEGPYSSLVKKPNGYVYGTTRGGGNNNAGVLFEYQPLSNALSVKVYFDGTNKGRSPYSRLLVANNGKLYGLTSTGGVNNQGVLFEYNTTTNTYTKVVDFNEISKGKWPFGSLAEGTNGKLYGMTSGGGTNGCGVLFEYNIATNVFAKKIDFVDSLGKEPWSTLTLAYNGKFYGTTRYGGIGKGVLFEYDYINNNYDKKLSFSTSPGGSDPIGGLLYTSTARIFGMTSKGGNYGGGVLFEVDIPSNTFIKKYDLYSSRDGSGAVGNLIEATNAKLYGVTKYGGQYSCGTIIEYNIALDTLINIHSFDYTNGSAPEGSLIEASNGKLYGMTRRGGLYNQGTIYEFDLSNSTFTSLHTFRADSTGSLPYGRLTEAHNGKLYGITSDGGNSSNYAYGVLFEYDIVTDTFSLKKVFDGNGNTGTYPKGSLIQAMDGKLYSRSSNAWIFNYDIINDTLTMKLNIAMSGGGYYGDHKNLMMASSGKMYGVTEHGGVNNRGEIFEYNPSNNNFITRFSFNVLNGDNPVGDLIQVGGCFPSYSQIDTIVCDTFIPPSGNSSIVNSGTYYDLLSISNVCGADSIVIVNLKVNKSYELRDTISLCSGSSYTFPDNTTENNITTQTTHFSNFSSLITGCDSIIATTILIKTIDTNINKSGITLSANYSGASYQWLDCDNNFSKLIGDTNQLFIPVINGSYAVDITYNGCNDTSSCYIINSVDITSGNSFEEPIKIFPNPTTGTINIDVGQQLSQLIINVRNVNGILIQQYLFYNKQHFKIEIEGSKGIYLIEVLSENKRGLFKIEKQ